MCSDCTDRQSTYEAAVAACEALDLHPEWPTFDATWNITQRSASSEERRAVAAFYAAQRALKRIWRCPPPLQEREAGR